MSWDDWKGIGVILGENLGLFDPLEEPLGGVDFLFSLTLLLVEAPIPTEESGFNVERNCCVDVFLKCF